MWGKLDTIGAGKILRDRLGIDSTGTLVMKISNFLEVEAESEECLLGVSVGGLIPILANTATLTRSLLAGLIRS